jgi:hypothetical protein
MIEYNEKLEVEIGLTQTHEKLMVAAEYHLLIFLKVIQYMVY